jgi:MoaA/NifB/PqqE/SkfB family radical SAM enzyme
LIEPRLALNLSGDRLAALPLAIVYVTDRCNSRCVSCDYWQHGQTNLPVAVAQRLGPELRALGTQVVLLSGGEPLVHPRWAEIAEALRDNGLRLWLLTAGLSLARHAERVSQLCERVTISLDGATPATYRAIRGVDGFEAVCRGLEAVVARGRPVTVRCTVQRGNYRELPRLVRLAQALGAAHISFLAVDVSNRVAFARAEANERSLALSGEDLPEFAAVLDTLEREFEPEFASGFIAERPAKLRRLHQYFAALLGQGDFPPVRCNAPRFSAVIGADGHLQPCYFIDSAAGLGDQPLAKTLNTPELMDLRQAIRTGRRAECQTCVCSMHRSARNLVTGNW